MQLEGKKVMCPK